MLTLQLGCEFIDSAYIFTYITLLLKDFTSFAKLMSYLIMGKLGFLHDFILLKLRVIYSSTGTHKVTSPNEIVKPENGCTFQS